MSDGGEVAIETMSAAAKSDGVDVRTGHRVQRLIKNSAGEVIGVEADTPKGKKRFFARKAVVFCTGGFTHNVELRKNFQAVPIYGGCAANSNEGDFVYIASTVGAQLRNMNYAWMCPIVFEKAMARDPELIGTFSPSGNSMIYVNKEGRRVANEKLAYNEMAQTFFQWDGAKSEYPNLLLIAVWDQRSQDHSASDEYGRFIVPPGASDKHVIKGATLATLSQAIGERLARYKKVTGGLALAPDFEKTLASTIERFNGFAPAAATSISIAVSVRSSCSLTAMWRPRLRPESDHVPDFRAGAVLRGATHRRQSRHQGRSQGQRCRPGG